MGKKQTKRQRKFQATGGVKGRLEKGTMASGQHKSKGPPSSRGGNKRKAPSRQQQQQQRGAEAGAPAEAPAPPSKKPARGRRGDERAADDRDRPDDDLTGPRNLGDMDIDSFFAQFGEDEEEGAPADDPAATAAAEDGAKREQDDANEQSDSSDSEGGEEEEDAARKTASTDRGDSSSSSTSDGSSSSSGSDSGDSDQDDDVEAAERRMKAEMSKMRRSDPEFHEFLKENEESLLEFGEDDNQDEDAGAELEEDDVRDVEESKRKSPSVTSSEIPLTPQLLAQLSKGTFQQHGVKSLKKLLGAYKSACYLADGAETDTKHRPGESGQTYLIDSPKVFDDLMVLCLNRCHEEFHYHLLLDGGQPKPDSSENDAEEGEKDEDSSNNNKPIHPHKLEKAARWNDLRPIMLTFFRSTLRVLQDAKEPELLAFVLKALSNYLRYLTPFPRLAEATLRSLTGLWSAPLDASEDYQVVRVNAFLRIRQLALTQPFPFIEECLKKTYLAYAQRAKFGSSLSSSPALPTLTFMGNCLVELYSLDFDSSYQHAFVYIRQLALLLRTALQKKTLEAMQQVYCWQYLHCLKLWVAVLSGAVPADDGTPMRSLVYPLTEVILGAIRWVPSPVRHAPLRFHCVRLLQQLAASAEVFIPITSLLLDCLDWKEWTLPPKKSRSARETRGLQLSLMLKLGKEDPLRTHEQLEAAMSEFFVLLHREVELYRYSAGFPEFAIRIVARLRQFAKEVRNPRFRAYAKACIDLCDKYSKFAVQARSKLQEAPKDVKMLECLKPATEKSMRERHAASIEKEQKALEASRPPAESSAKKSEETEAADDDSDSLEESEEEKKSAKQKKKNGRKQSQKPKFSRGELEKRMMADEKVMEEQDQVQEGVDWLDED